MGDWQPIETAPKDGTPMLLTYWNDQTQDTLPVTSGFWSRLSDRWWSEISQKGCKPTHWMPLPLPPSQREG